MPSNKQTKQNNAVTRQRAAGDPTSYPTRKMKFPLRSLPRPWTSAQLYEATDLGRKTPGLNTTTPFSPCSSRPTPTPSGLTSRNQDGEGGGGEGGGLSASRPSTWAVGGHNLRPRYGWG